jgi:hypothetical protein
MHFSMKQEWYKGLRWNRYGDLWGSEMLCLDSLLTDGG